jgi:2,4-dienoyl-CoA reductase-like NADH-dependent reductase (Old Yellow Enzyme family)
MIRLDDAGGEARSGRAIGADRLAPLFAPLKLRRITLPNRFVMAPMTRSFSPDGIPGADVAAYYRRRAEAEVGLIVTEGAGIPHEAAIGYSGVDVLRIPSLYGEAALAGWKQVVKGVHEEGGMIAPQLWHQGVMRSHGTGAWPDAVSMRPSGIWGPTGRASTVPQAYIDTVAADTRPMTESEIGDVIQAYVRAAANAKNVGFDAIAIHGAHGYLIDTFLWHETNRRTDQWGGDIERRSAFAAALIRAIRREIGEDMPIMLRYSQWKQQDFHGALVSTPDELARMLAPIAEAGVDIFDISERNFDRPAFAGSPLSLAGWTRKLTGRTTMAVGSVGLSKPMYESHRDGGAAVEDNLDRVAERFEAGEFDLVGVGRMLVVHPDWVRRVRLGQPFSAYDRSLLANLV